MVNIVNHPWNSGAVAFQQISFPASPSIDILALITTPLHNYYYTASHITSKQHLAWPTNDDRLRTMAKAKII